MVTAIKRGFTKGFPPQDTRANHSGEFAKTSGFHGGQGLLLASSNMALYCTRLRYYADNYNYGTSQCNRVMYSNVLVDCNDLKK